MEKYVITRIEENNTPSYSYSKPGFFGTGVSPYEHMLSSLFDMAMKDRRQIEIECQNLDKEQQTLADIMKQEINHRLSGNSKPKLDDNKDGLVQYVIDFKGIERHSKDQLAGNNKESFENSIYGFYKNAILEKTPVELECDGFTLEMEFIADIVKDYVNRKIGERHEQRKSD